MGSKYRWGRTYTLHHTKQSVGEAYRIDIEIASQEGKGAITYETTLNLGASLVDGKYNNLDYIVMPPNVHILKLVADLFDGLASHEYAVDGIAPRCNLAVVVRKMKALGLQQVVNVPGLLQPIPVDQWTPHDVWASVVEDTLSRKRVMAANEGDAQFALLRKMNIEVGNTNDWVYTTYWRTWLTSGMPVALMHERSENEEAPLLELPDAPLSCIGQ